jgi:hypothetical protein
MDGSSFFDYKRLNLRRQINERMKLQFQAQAFNVMNVQFLGVPDPVLDDTGSGQFQST